MGVVPPSLRPNKPNLKAGITVAITKSVQTFKAQEEQPMAKSIQGAANPAQSLNRVSNQSQNQSCCSQASACCKKGAACCGKDGNVDTKQLIKMMKQLMKLAKQDPKGVAQALQQNPQFAQMLQQGIGGGAGAGGAGLAGMI